MLNPPAHSQLVRADAARHEASDVGAQAVHPARRKPRAVILLPREGDDAAVAAPLVAKVDAVVERLDAEIGEVVAHPVPQMQHVHACKRRACTRRDDASE